MSSDRYPITPPGGAEKTAQNHKIDIGTTGIAHTFISSSSLIHHHDLTKAIKVTHILLMTSTARYAEDIATQ